MDAYWGHIAAFDSVVIVVFAILYYRRGWKIKVLKAEIELFKAQCGLAHQDGQMKGYIQGAHATQRTEQ